MMTNMTVFKSGLIAPTALVNKVRREILNIYPAMQKNVLYSVEDMCGQALWDSLTRYENILAGRIVPQLIKLGQLPITHGPFNYSQPYPKKYLIQR